MNISALLLTDLGRGTRNCQRTKKEHYHLNGLSTGIASTIIPPFSRTRKINKPKLDENVTCDLERMGN